MGESYRIGDWQFDAAAAALLGAGGERRLEDRAARTLALLCRRRGEIVSQQAILEAVWNGRAVSPNSVAVVIADLRRELGEDAREPRHIVTIPKRGYRLSADARRPGRGRAAAALAAALLLAAGAAVTAGRLRHAENEILLVEPVRNDTGQPRYAPLATALDQLVANRAMRIDGIRIVRGKAASPGMLRLDSSLILWNGQPTLSLSATDVGSGALVWSAMAAGPEEALARNTIERLDGLGSKVRTSGKL